MWDQVAGTGGRGTVVGSFCHDQVVDAAGLDQVVDPVRRDQVVDATARDQVVDEEGVFTSVPLIRVEIPISAPESAVHCVM